MPWTQTQTPVNSACRRVFDLRREREERQIDPLEGTNGIPFDRFRDAQKPTYGGNPGIRRQCVGAAVRLPRPPRQIKVKFRGFAVYWVTGSHAWRWFSNASTSSV
ncbi:hypothetical protein GCM10009834_29320 [Streptomonospora arabica]